MDVEHEIVQLKQAFISLQSWIITQDQSIVSRLDAIDKKGGLKKPHKTPPPKNTYILEDPDGAEHTTDNLTKFFRGRLADEMKLNSVLSNILSRGKYKGWKLVEKIENA